MLLTGGKTEPFNAPNLDSPQKVVFISPPSVGKTKLPTKYVRGVDPGYLGSDLDVLEAVQGLEPDEWAPLPIAEA